MEHQLKVVNDFILLENLTSLKALGLLTIYISSRTLSEGPQASADEYIDHHFMTTLHRNSVMLSLTRCQLKTPLYVTHLFTHHSLACAAFNKGARSIIIHSSQPSTTLYLHLQKIFSKTSHWHPAHLKVPTMRTQPKNIDNLGGVGSSATMSATASDPSPQKAILIELIALHVSQRSTRHLSRASRTVGWPTHSHSYKQTGQKSYFKSAQDLVDATIESKSELVKFLRATSGPPTEEMAENAFKNLQVRSL